MLNPNVFRYRIITNLQCNQKCYFCFQPDKRDKILDLDFMKKTMQKVGKLKRATIMGGESLLLDNIVDYFKIANKYADTLCLVTNGSLLTESLVKDLVANGLQEMAISISSMQQFDARLEQILFSNKLVPNLRLNIPKCNESTGEKLYALVDRALTNDIGVVVCEDLMGRYNTVHGDCLADLTQGMRAELLNDDGHNFYTLRWKGREFGLFGYQGNDKAKIGTAESGYEKTDIIITPDTRNEDKYSGRVYSVWADYCRDVGNSELA